MLRRTEADIEDKRRLEREMGERGGSKRLRAES